MSSKRTFFNGRLTLSSDRWTWDRRVMGLPGERYGWARPDGMGRFGGGWNYSLGFQSGGWSRRYGITIMINLLIGMVMITYHSREAREAERLRIEKAKKRSRPVDGLLSWA